jgi:hypothetical protein
VCVCVFACVCYVVAYRIRIGGEYRLVTWSKESSGRRWTVGLRTRAALHVQPRREVLMRRVFGLYLPLGGTSPRPEAAWFAGLELVVTPHMTHLRSARALICKFCTFFGMR